MTPRKEETDEEDAHEKRWELWPGFKHTEMCTLVNNHLLMQEKQRKEEERRKETAGGVLSRSSWGLLTLVLVHHQVESLTPVFFFSPSSSWSHSYLHFFRRQRRSGMETRNTRQTEGSYVKTGKTRNEGEESSWRKEPSSPSVVASHSLTTMKRQAVDTFE